MRKEWGATARRSIFGALILALATSSNALAMGSPNLVGTAIGEGRPPVVALAAVLDRAAIAPSRERARLGAIAAAYAWAHPAAPKKAHAPAPKHHAATKAVVRNHLWFPALGMS